MACESIDIVCLISGDTRFRSAKKSFSNCLSDARARCLYIWSRHSKTLGLSGRLRVLMKRGEPNLQRDLARHSINLQGRVIVVAGAGGGGMGTAIVRLVASAGAHVIAVDRSEESLSKFIAPMASEGLLVTPLLANLEGDEGVTDVINCVRQTKGDLYGLVTVVGGAHQSDWGRATKVSRQAWDLLLSRNLDSMFFITQAVAAELLSLGRPGSMVAISSISGLSAAPYHIAYGAAKAAILSVVRTLALELASAGIRVNAIAPGAVTTPVAVFQSDPARDRQAIPMARQGSSHEIAAAVLFLLSDMASYMTGQCLVVDGGIGLKSCHLDEENCPVLVTDKAFLESMKR
jgi:3-oxoacyl-[acyl-carrier protein] reductase